VRPATEGETITLLGGAEKTLTGTETLITDADTGAALALAGVKGGSLAELDAETTDIIVEAATFDPVITRKTAAKHDVRTDASKRFENKVAPVLPAHGMEAVVALITTVAGGVVEGYAHTDMPVSAPYKLGVSVAEANRVLGTAMEEGQARALIERLGYAHEYLSDPRAVFLETVRAQLGKPYKLGASVTKEAPALFDCSSLVAYAAAQAGVSMPRISIDQYVWTDRVEKSDLQPGDLVFFNTQKDQTKVWFETKEFLPGTAVTEGISHVGVYMGDDMLIHARKTENAVVEEPLADVERRVEATVGYGRITVLQSPRIVITVPPERYDLRIKEDLIEEMGRAFGYGNIVATPLPTRPVVRRILSTHALAEKARAALGALAFQEVYTYALADTGDAVLSSALASDKSALRSNLSDGLVEALSLNEYNAPLLGLADIRVFEVGTVFGVDDEEVRIGIAARASQGKKRVERTAAILKEAKDALALIFGEDALEWVHEGGETAEFNLTAYAHAHSQTAYPVLPQVQAGVTYKAPSAYPFVLRDIALWVAGDIDEASVQSSIRDAAGELLVRIDQFDRFEKEGRVSYAFHLVFQSREKTLSDEEVTARMNAVVDACVQAGYEVR
jgi:phenylalanyl-tRNA synthetase beta subunit